MHVGSAAALAPTDWIYAQYREAGVLMWRGFTISQFMNQCHSNEQDFGKGRQMPVHYGCRDLYFQTIKSTLTTQLPQAAGAAYAARLRKDLAINDPAEKAPLDQVVMCYFGEGAASEGDFHAALNMAATRGCPVIFFCRNNGYAISTSTADQYRGDGIVSRAAGYGMAGIRVDGNDCFAVYNAVKEARRVAVERNEPVLIEAMSYRVGHHSTSDDSTVYRTAAEVELVKKYDNPIDRLGAYLRAKGWWSDQEEKELLSTARTNVLKELKAAEKRPKPPAADLFNDVYDELPPHLVKQKEQLKKLIEMYPQDYDMTLYAGGKLD
jgi:2-oxoisovalerate dehydrogenase E1 component alpha subunit